MNVEWSPLECRPTAGPAVGVAFVVVLALAVALVVPHSVTAGPDPVADPVSTDQSALDGSVGASAVAGGEHTAMSSWTNESSVEVADDALLVGGATGATASGSLSVEENLDPGQGRFEVRYEVSGLSGEKAHLVVAKPSTDSTYHERVSGSGTTTVHASDVGGLEDGDILAVALFAPNGSTPLDEEILTVGDVTLDTIGLSATPSTVDFGRVPPESNATTEVVIRNDGSDPIRVPSVTVSGGDSGAFRVSPGSLEVPSNDEATLTVEFTPSVSGQYSGTVVFEGDDVTIPAVSLAGNASGPELQVDRESIRFDNLSVGETARETVTVRNTGDAPLSVTRAELGDTSGAFSLQGGGSFSLDPGEARELTVTLDPEHEGAPSTTLFVESDDPTDPTRAVYVSSSRVDASVTVDETNSTTQVEATAERVTPDDPAEIEIPDADEDDGFGVDSLTVTTERERSVGVNITASGRPLGTTPDTEAGFPNATRRLGNLSVEATVPNDQIRSVSFTHRVSKARLDQLGTAPGEVALYRFNETTEQWVEKNTTVVTETDTEVVLRTRGDGFSEWTAAAKRPDIRVADASASVDAATVGEEILIQVELTNDGGADGVFETKLLLNGTVVEQRDVTVPDGGTVPVDFERQMEEAGNYEVTVNDVLVGTIDVDEGSGEAEVTTPSDDTQDETGDGDSGDGGGGESSVLSTPLVFGLGALLLLTALGVVLYSGRSGDAVSGVDETADEDTRTLEIEGFDDELDTDQQDDTDGGDR